MCVELWQCCLSVTEPTITVCPSVVVAAVHSFCGLLQCGQLPVDTFFFFPSLFAVHQNGHSWFQWCCHIMALNNIAAFCSPRKNKPTYVHQDLAPISVSLKCKIKFCLFKCECFRIPPNSCSLPLLCVNIQLEPDCFLGKKKSKAECSQKVGQIYQPLFTFVVLFYHSTFSNFSDNLSLNSWSCLKKLLLGQRVCIKTLWLLALPNSFLGL